MGRIPKHVEAPAASTGPVAIQIAHVQKGSRSIDTDAPDLDESALATVISFFRVLDRWDRERRRPC
jgi:hypothetical protein